MSPGTACSLSLACNAAGLRVAAASVTFSLDATTSSDAKERGKDTVMEDKVVVTVCKGSDVGTARRSMGGDDDGGGQLGAVWEVTEDQLHLYGGAEPNSMFRVEICDEQLTMNDVAMKILLQMNIQIQCLGSLIESFTYCI